MNRKRQRMKGRFGGEGERFARMTQTLLEHPSVTSLSHAAFRVLTVLAVGAYAPGLDVAGNNGTQAMTASHAKRYGFNSHDTLSRALKALLERGLIVKTRAGCRNKRGFSLYAMGWLPITHRDGKPLDSAEKAPDRWKQWPRCEDLPPDHRERLTPVGGQQPDSRRDFRPDHVGLESEIQPDGR
jgi:hypothetical protein